MTSCYRCTGRERWGLGEELQRKLLNCFDELLDGLVYLNDYNKKARHTKKLLEMVQEAKHYMETFE